MKTGGCEAYFHLAEQFTTQADPAFCGISSLVMVLNALSMDPGRSWIGSVWRWYHEDMMDGVCRKLDDVRQFGITLSEFSCMARCHGCEVSLCFASEDDADVERSLLEFRSAIKDSLCVRQMDDCQLRFLVAAYRFPCHLSFRRFSSERLKIRIASPFLAEKCPTLARRALVVHRCLIARPGQGSFSTRRHSTAPPPQPMHPRSAPGRRASDSGHGGADICFFE